MVGVWALIGNPSAAAGVWGELGQGRDVLVALTSSLARVRHALGGVVYSLLTDTQMVNEAGQDSSSYT